MSASEALTTSRHGSQFLGAIATAQGFGSSDRPILYIFNDDVNRYAFVYTVAKVT